MAVSKFGADIWRVSGLTLADTPEVQLPAASLEVGAQAVDTTNVRLFEVAYDDGLSGHVWILTGPVSLSGAGTATLNFGSGKETQTASVVIGGQVAILSTSVIALTLGPGPTPEHSVDEHAMASTVMGLTARNVTSGSGFTIEGTIQDGARGRFIVSWSWRNA